MALKEKAEKGEAEKDEAEEGGTIEFVTSWGLVLLAVIAATAALVRMFGPDTIRVAQGLDQTTLLYLGVAGALLLLKQIKTFSLGQMKFEMIERIRERQDKQAESLADISLILPLLLPRTEVKHISNLFRKTTRYRGQPELKTELRRLASTGLIERTDRRIHEIEDGKEFDLAKFVKLTDLGRRWAARIDEIEATEGRAS